MQTHVIEATNGPNYGKFLLGRMDEEWSLRTALYPDMPSGQAPLLRQLGWGPDHLWVLDLQTGEGAFFRPGGSASSDLNKHAIWVCPLYEHFLGWLYQQDLGDITALPRMVELPYAPFAMQGYRRSGPKD